MTDFADIEYLKTGTDSQRKAYEILTRGRYMDLLVHYGPKLTGSIPIAVDLPGSDIDLACSFTDAMKYEQDLQERFSSKPGYAIRKTAKYGNEAIVVRFEDAGMPIEIFGQAIPVSQQMSYRHLLIEARLLQEQPPRFRADVIRLKQAGLSTEAAFCSLLGLTGDPYMALLELENR
ncbi:DUF4269 domain-containing protein [Pedobacter sp. SYP-B3415]|uniref:DUF4269 domain-containing protein n=1 Tax=Pedobacter sp. SYP-B3415 TaxID=2496641 RepID=UPI00101BD113|nr:DUF4269 domain-containing protein [Pedobacter sp. SYP-B3415]